MVTENSVRSENTGAPIIRKIMVATTISSLFVALLALVASSFRTYATPQGGDPCGVRSDSNTLCLLVQEFGFNRPVTVK